MGSHTPGQPHAELAKQKVRDLLHADDAWLRTDVCRVCSSERKQDKQAAPLLRVSEAVIRRLASVSRAAGLPGFQNEYSEFIVYGRFHYKPFGETRPACESMRKEKN